MAIVVVAVALGVEVSNHGGQRVPHRGAIGKQARPAGSCRAQNLAHIKIPFIVSHDIQHRPFVLVIYIVQSEHIQWLLKYPPSEEAAALVSPAVT